MTRIVSITAILAAMSSAAYAGSLQEPVVEPVPVAPVVPVANDGGDWTGFYMGGQVGQLDGELDSGAEGDDVAYGLHAGYNYDFGRFVMGGELDYDKTDLSLGGAEVDSVARAKLKAGYDFGNVLAYVTGGAAQIDTSVGDETGEFYGIGAAYKLTEQWSLGGEVLQHNFDDVDGAGTGADGTSLMLRASYNF